MEITFHFPYVHLPKMYKPYEIKFIFLMGLVQYQFGSHFQIFSNLLHFSQKLNIALEFSLILKRSHTNHFMEIILFSHIQILIKLKGVNLWSFKCS